MKHGLKCPSAYRVGANVRDTDAARRRERRRRRLGKGSSVRLRGLTKVEEMVVDVSPLDVTAGEFSGSPSGTESEVEAPAPSDPGCGGEADADPGLVGAGDPTPPVVRPDPNPPAVASGVSPDPGEQPPLLPSAGRQVSAAPAAVPSEVAAFVGPGRDLASLRSCVGLCDPQPGVLPGLCSDAVNASRLLVPFRCSELYCPGPATPGGIMGFRGYACVSIEQVSRHLAEHGHSPDQVLQRVLEVLSNEVLRRRAAVQCPALSRRVRCAYPTCPAVGTVREMWGHAEEYHCFRGTGLADDFYGWHSSLSPRERAAARLIVEELSGLEVGRTLKRLTLPRIDGTRLDDGLLDVCLGMREGTLPASGVEVVLGWAEPSFVKK